MEKKIIDKIVTEFVTNANIGEKIDIPSIMNATRKSQSEGLIPPSAGFAQTNLELGVWYADMMVHRSKFQSTLDEIKRRGLETMTDEEILNTLPQNAVDWKVQENHLKKVLVLCVKQSLKAGSVEHNLSMEEIKEALHFPPGLNPQSPEYNQGVNGSF